MAPTASRFSMIEPFAICMDCGREFALTCAETEAVNELTQDFGPSIVIDSLCDDCIAKRQSRRGELP